MVSAQGPGMRYWGFISYSRADEDAAKWLHGAVERYSLPRKLVGRTVDDTTAPKRLFPLFRDSDELPASSSIGDALNEALAQSRNLIVLCSPHSAVSKWVNEEILRFKRLGRGDRIFCVILRGEPDTAFPESLRNVLSAASAESTLSIDVPLAADLRPGGDGKHLTLLKVVAGLLKLRLDELIARDQRRRRWRVLQASAALLLVFLLGGGVWLNGQRKIRVQERVAATQAMVARAQGLANDLTRLPTAALLGVKAWRDAFELGLPAQQALDVMRRTASLLPLPTPLRLHSKTAVKHGVATADGHWLATPDDESVLLWDARTGSLVATIRPGAPVDALAFTPEANLLVVAGEEVQTWAPASATRIGSLHIKGLSDTPALSTSGRWLAGGIGSRRDIGVWDLKDGGKMTLKLQPDVPVIKLAISSDGKRLAAGVAEMSNSGPVNPGWRLWDVRTGALLTRGKAASYTGGVEFSPGGRTLAISSGNIELIDAATGQSIGAVRGSSDELAWAPNERWLAGSSSPVQVWDAISGDEVARVPTDGGVVSFSSDGSRLFTTDGRSWRMNTRLQLELLLSAPGTNPINSIAFGGTTHLATAQQGGDVVTWQLDEAARGPTLQEGRSARVVAVSDDGRFALTMSGNTLGSMWSARLWDARTGKKLAELSPGGHVHDGSFSVDGSQLAMSDDEGVLTIYSTKDGSVIARTKPPAPTKAPRTYVLSALPGSSRWLALDSEGALVWGAGYEKPEYLNIGENPVFAISDNGKSLWQAGPGLLVERDAQTLHEKRRVQGIGRQISRLAVSHDSNLVAMVVDGSIRILDGNAGRPVFDLPLPEIAAKKPEGKSVYVSGLVLSPDGHWLALALATEREQQRPATEISLWSLDKRARVAVLEGHAEDVTFSSDGSRFAFITRDGLVRVIEWIPTRLIADLCARVGRDLTARERSDYLAMTDGRRVCGE